MLRYSILPLPEKHLYRVTLSFTPRSCDTDLYMAAWTSGSYLIRDYSGRIRKPVFSEGTFIQTSKNTWHGENLPIGEAVTVTYDVFSFSEGIHDAWLDHTRGFINPAALFLIPQEHQNETIEIEFADSGFTPYSSLSLLSERTFSARDIQELLDAPFTLTPDSNPGLLLEIDSHGISHRLLFTGIASLNETRIRNDVKAILDTTIDLWGKTPFESYLFHIHLGPNLFGGLEHEASCVLLKDSASLPAQFEDTVPEDYDDFLRLLAHEYFHAWVVKYLRPAVFLPYDLRSEQYTHDLWVFEGITSYYENLIPFRAGTIDEKTFIKRMSDRFRYVREREGFAEESLADAGFNAWIHLYKQTADSAYSQSSYYGKGAILTFIIDMALRSRSQGKASLDNVLRFWFERALAKPSERALRDGGFGDIVDEALGFGLSATIDRLVSSTELSEWRDAWNKSLAFAGLLETENKNPQNAAQRFAGLFVRNDHGRLTVAYTASSGAFYKAGFFAGDELVAIDGIRVTSKSLPRQIEAARGRTVTVVSFRANRLFEREVSVPADPLSLAGNLTPSDETDLSAVFRSTSR